jgi:hypothetical protein
MADLLEPKRLRILRALQAKLQVIKVSNGFWTDAGDHVMLGRFRIGTGGTIQDSLPAITLKFPRAESPAEGARVQYDLPVLIEALVLEDQDDALAEAELVIGDIKRALYGPGADETLGGLIFEMVPGAVEPIIREEGSQYAGAACEMVCKMNEKRGEPEN